MTRLFAILARSSRKAVILRRGPSKQVALIAWDRSDDSFEIGQWFKGRIYERRCDLSPSGRLFVYFAAKHKGPIQTWTGISRPPYLTALALWPNLGTWAGGGLFESENSLLLNQVGGIEDLAKGLEVPDSLKLRLLPRGDSIDEMDSIYHDRLLRDGWTLAEWGARTEQKTSRGLNWSYYPARAYERKLVRKKVTQVLRMEVRGLNEPQKGWYTLNFEVFGKEGSSLLRLPGVSWADWDGNGDLLFAEGGKLFRLPWSNHHAHGRNAARELADFSALTFTAKEAPKRARSW